MVTAVNRSTAGHVEQHLRACDADFIPPLSSRLDISTYAQKIAAAAERFEVWEGDQLLGLVAMYCNDASGVRAYITSVSVLKSAVGKGIASRLLRDSIAHARAAGVRRVTLDVAAGNHRAIAIYEQHGFVKHQLENSNWTMILELEPSGTRS